MNSLPIILVNPTALALSRAWWNIFSGDPAHWTFMCIPTVYSRVPTQDDITRRDSFITTHLFSPNTHHLEHLTCELSSIWYVCIVCLDHQSDSNLVISCISYRMKTHEHNTLSKALYLYQFPSYIVAPMLQTSAGLKDDVEDAVARSIASKTFCWA